MEKYITKNGITGKMADALMAWDKGNQGVAEIASFYGINPDDLYRHAMIYTGRW